MGEYLFHITNDFEIRVDVDNFEVHIDIFQVGMCVRFEIKSDALLFAEDISLFMQRVKDNIFNALLWGHEISLSDYNQIIDYVKEYNGHIVTIYPDGFNGFAYRTHGYISTLGFVEVNCDYMDNPVILEIKVPEQEVDRLASFLEDVTALLTYIFMVE